MGDSLDDLLRALEGQGLEGLVELPEEDGACLDLNRASRKGVRSDARMRPAPDARAIPIEKRPIGPQPRIATERPARSCFPTAKTAFPNGSCSVAISGGNFDRSLCQITDSGTTTNSAKAPSRSTPRIRVRSHMCAWPVRQWKHMPQVMWLSAET